MGTDTTDCPYSVGDTVRIAFQGVGGRPIGIGEETVTAVQVPGPWPERYRLATTHDSPLWRRCVTFHLVTSDRDDPLMTATEKGTTNDQ